MTKSKAELFGAALAKAVKAATGITSARLGVAIRRTNIRDVPKLGALPWETGRSEVQFLIDKVSAGADNLVGWSVLKPGASQERHRHRNCDEFLIVLTGHGHVITEPGLEPCSEGEVIYAPRGVWHGFKNTSGHDVVLVWGWIGAGSVEASGTETTAEGRNG
jgi:mannose-6-phosphate isomerase-like protein (cupin superfamily)